VQAQQQHSRATARPDPQAEQGVAEPAVYFVLGIILTKKVEQK